MLRFVLRRLTLMIPVLIGLSILLFAWVRALPGDPARALLGERATPEGLARVTEAYGFDEPLLEQYLLYVKALLQGDFGSSIQTGQAVLDSFTEKFPATLELGITAMLIAVVVGVPTGLPRRPPPGTALRHRRGVRVAARGGDSGVLPGDPAQAGLRRLAGLAADGAGRQDPRIDATHPTGFYVLDGIITQEWDAAWDAILHLILPAIALATIPLAIIVRITRASVSEVMHEDYVRTAESKGLSRVATISRRHVLRNALLPVVTVIGLQTGLLFSGAVLTETVFNFNGIGQYLFEAIRQRDYPVLQGYIIFIAIIYSIINLIVDLAYGVIDPRVRVG